MYGRDKLPAEARSVRIYREIQTNSDIINDAIFKEPVSMCSHLTLPSQCNQSNQIVPSKFGPIEEKKATKFLPYLEIRTTFGERPIFTLLDSGSQICLIRHQTLRFLTEVYIPPNERCWIKTVAGPKGPLKTCYFNLHPPNMHPITLACVIVDTIAQRSSYLSKEDLEKLDIPRSTLNKLNLCSTKSELKKYENLDLIIGIPYVYYLMKKQVHIPVNDVNNEGYSLFSIETPYGNLLSGGKGEITLDLQPSDTTVDAYEKYKRTLFQSYMTYVDQYPVEKIECISQPTISFSFAVTKMTRATMANLQLVDLLERQWRLERMAGDDTVKLTKAEAECLTFLKATTRYIESERKFQVRLPFKKTPKFKNENFLILRKYYAFEKSLLRDEVKYAAFHERVEANIKDGVYKPLSEEETKLVTDPTFENCYFCPTQVVCAAGNITSSARPVFNASFDASKSDSDYCSLNAALHKGLQPQKDLTVLHCVWRRHLIVFLADIKRQFNQIKLHPNDQLYQLFYYRPRGLENSTEPPKIYKICSVNMGVTSSSIHAFHVLNEVCQLAVKKWPNDQEIAEAAGILLNVVWADDFLCGERSVAEAIRLNKTMQKILDLASFQLSKYVSNSKAFMDSIPEEHRNPKFDPEVLLNFNESNIDDTPWEIKPLGITFSPITDNYKFTEASHLEELDAKNKRQMLKIFASFSFDPLGKCSPFVLFAKNLMQQAHKLNLSWDEPLPDEIKRKWDVWARSAKDLETLSLPRYLPICSEFDNQEIHFFSDGSENGFAANCFLVYSAKENPNDVKDIKPIAQTEIPLHEHEKEGIYIIGKSRCCPIKEQSIPRLELLGMMLVVTLLDQLKQAFPDLTEEKCRAWSDSEICLAWLKKPVESLMLFQSNRVRIIKEANLQWNHVRSEDNASDAGSRGILPKELYRWLNCPSYLLRKGDPLKEYVSTNKLKLDSGSDKWTPYMEGIKTNDLFQVNFAQLEVLDYATGYNTQNPGQTVTESLIKKDKKRWGKVDSFSGESWHPPLRCFEMLRVPKGGQLPPPGTAIQTTGELFQALPELGITNLLERTNSLEKLINVFGYIMKYIWARMAIYAERVEEKMKLELTGSKKGKLDDLNALMFSRFPKFSNYETLSPQQMKKACIYFFARFTQQVKEPELYAEFERLQNKEIRNLPKRFEHYQKDGFYFDSVNQLIRVDYKLGKSKAIRLTFDEKFPVYLPTKSRFCEILIISSHYENFGPRPRIVKMPPATPNKKEHLGLTKLNYNEGKTTNLNNPDQLGFYGTSERRRKIDLRDQGEIFWKVLHRPKNQMVVDLRQNFHIAHLQEECKRVVRSCMQCEKLNTVKQGQSSGQRPNSALQPLKAGQAVVFDLLGPLICVNDNAHTRKNPCRKVKRYVAVIYCLNTHFVLYRLCMDKTRTEIVKCIQEFSCLYGPTFLCYADNAAEHHGTDLLIRKHQVDPDYLNMFAENLKHTGIEFVYGPPYGSWYQSRAELHVKVLKKTIIKMFDSLQGFTESELIHHLIVISAICNDRPLATVNQETHTEILTPRTLMLGSFSSCYPYYNLAKFVTKTKEYEVLRKRQELRNRFADKYIKEILLMEKTKQSKWFRHKPIFKKGEIVLIESGNKHFKKNQFPIGRVVRAIAPPKNLRSGKYPQNLSLPRTYEIEVFSKENVDFVLTNKGSAEYAENIAEKFPGKKKNTVIKSAHQMFKLHSYNENEMENLIPEQQVMANMRQQQLKHVRYQNHITDSRYYGKF